LVYGNFLIDNEEKLNDTNLMITVINQSPTMKLRKSIAGIVVVAWSRTCILRKRF